MSYALSFLYLLVILGSTLLRDVHIGIPSSGGKLLFWSVSHSKFNSSFFHLKWLWFMQLLGELFPLFKVPMSTSITFTKVIMIR